MKPALLPVLSSALAACSAFDSGPEYSGPDDYAYTLRVPCFCLVTGPLRVTVRDGEVTDVVPLGALHLDAPYVQATVEERALTLVELSDLVRRARHAPYEVEVGPAYGYPTDVSIDPERNATDDEVGYSVRDFAPL